MDAILQQKQTRAFPWRNLSIALVMAVIIGSGAIYGYVYTQRPDLWKQLLIKVDVNHYDAAEVDRIDNINRLPISYEEKQVLINRTIFMGASPQMVMLALGQPKEGHKIVPTNSGGSVKESIILIYHLQGEARPTVLRFDDNKLTEAKKGSSIDYAKTPVPYTGINSE